MKDALPIIGSILGILTFVGGVLSVVFGKLLKDKSNEIQNNVELQKLKQFIELELGHLKEKIETIEERVEKHIKPAT